MQADKLGCNTCESESYDNNVWLELVLLLVLLKKKGMHWKWPLLSISDGSLFNFYQCCI